MLIFVIAEQRYSRDITTTFQRVAVGGFVSCNQRLIVIAEMIITYPLLKR